MRPTRTLPENYAPAGTIDLSKDRRALVLMNVLAIGILAGFGYLFMVIMIRLRPVDGPATLNYSITGPLGILLALLYITALYAVVIILHEAVHGIFFWLFTRTRPIFAFKIWYAYAAAPGWYLPRNLYAVVAISPLVVLSLLGILLFLFIPGWMLMPVFLLITFNASGAVGDIVVLFWLFSKPPTCLAYDQGDAVTLYIREKT
ncbi:MAG TPA: DUF3267 domain-containing protein [Levilinea sp.]|nr:DUF3267 domain-containing protein [Levilinea sp.]